MYVLTDLFDFHLENPKYHRYNSNDILIPNHPLILGPFCNILFSYICLFTPTSFETNNSYFNKWPGPTFVACSLILSYAFKN